MLFCCDGLLLKVWESGGGGDGGEGWSEAVGKITENVCPCFVEGCLCVCLVVMEKMESGCRKRVW